MKKISFKNLNLEEVEQLSREQLKQVMGGFTGSGGSGNGSGTGSGAQQQCNCNVQEDCERGWQCGRCDGTEEGPINGFYGICSKGVTTG